MAGGGNGKEQNYWPGFVDVLSNVVLTLVFVLVVFVMALALSANKVEKRMQEILKEKAASESTSKPQETQAAVEIKHNESGAARKNDTVTSSGSVEIENNDTTQQSGTKTIDAPVDIRESSGKIVLYYPLSGVALSDKTAEKLQKALLYNKENLSKYKIILNSYLGQEQYSVANRLAYYRVLYIRKFLIDNGIADNQSITSKILQPEKPDVGHVEIILEKN